MSLAFVQLLSPSTFTLRCGAHHHPCVVSTIFHLLVKSHTFGAWSQYHIAGILVIHFLSKSLLDRIVAVSCLDLACSHSCTFFAGAFHVAKFVLGALLSISVTPFFLATNHLLVAIKSAFCLIVVSGFIGNHWPSLFSNSLTSASNAFLPASVVSSILLVSLSKFLSNLGKSHSISKKLFILFHILLSQKYCLIAFNHHQLTVSITFNALLYIFCIGDSILVFCLNLFTPSAILSINCLVVAISLYSKSNHLL
jgi:hypothetical protein